MNHSGNRMKPRYHRNALAGDDPDAQLRWPSSSVTRDGKIGTQDVGDVVGRCGLRMWYHPPAPRVEREGACGETMAETGMDEAVVMILRRSGRWGRPGMEGATEAVRPGEYGSTPAEPDRMGVCGTVEVRDAGRGVLVREPLGGESSPERARRGVGEWMEEGLVGKGGRGSDVRGLLR
jgi:hypothetical protein